MSKERFSRQSFLGPDSEARIARCTVGVAGLGGGGSHIIQQLAHIGFQRFVTYDGDVVEDSNLNRLVGATSVDVAAETLAHGGENLLGEAVLDAGTETGKEGGGKNLGGDSFLEGGGDSPAAFAGVLDEAGVSRQFRVGGEGLSGEIEQPGGDDAATAP